MKRLYKLWLQWRYRKARDPEFLIVLVCSAILALMFIVEMLPQ